MSMCIHTQCLQVRLENAQLSAYVMPFKFLRLLVLIHLGFCEQKGKKEKKRKKEKEKKEQHRGKNGMRLGQNRGGKIEGGRSETP